MRRAAFLGLDRAAALLGLVCAAALLACQSGKTPGNQVSPEPVAASRKPAFIAGSTDGSSVAPFVKGEMQRAARESAPLLVYVGASWCEPCQYFHQAVERGDLDRTFPGLRLVEFDMERDRDALERDGYKAPLIPLFAVPGPDGRASARMINGSIKGPDAVNRNLVPRLQKLLAGSP